jgi:acyl CoA:acetate/3-ketoacid CoA transferase alpha subunit
MCASDPFWKLLMSEFMSPAAAAEANVRDGDRVVMEGHPSHAPGHEVIRQRRRRLTLIRMTPDPIYDQLIVWGAWQGDDRDVDPPRRDA